MRTIVIFMSMLAISSFGDPNPKWEETPDIQQLKADVEAKKATLEEARRTGTIQEKMDASAAYNNARLRLERLIDQSQSQFYSQLAAKQNQSKKEAEKAKRLATTRVSPSKREALLPLYIESRDWINDHELIKGYLPSKNIPVVSDAASLDLIRWKSKDYIEKPVEVCVIISIGDRYYGTYGFDGDTHCREHYYPFRLTDVDKTGRINNDATTYAYVLQSYGEDLLLLANKDSAIRLRVLIAERESSINQDSRLLEIVDWQFRSKDNKWGPWFSEVETVGIPYLRKIRQIKAGHHAKMISLKADPIDVKRIKMEEESYKAEMNELLREFEQYKKDRGIGQ